MRRITVLIGALFLLACGGEQQSAAPLSSIAQGLPLKAEGEACLVWLETTPAKPCWAWSATYLGGNWKEGYNCWVRWCGASYGFEGCFSSNNTQCGRWTWVIADEGYCTIDFEDCPPRYYPADVQDEPAGFSPWKW